VILASQLNIYSWPESSDFISEEAKKDITEQNSCKKKQQKMS
jgi:hypothetical protein